MSFVCQPYVDRLHKGICLVYDPTCTNPHVVSCPVVDIRANGECIKYACHAVKNTAEQLLTTTIKPVVHSIESYQHLSVPGPLEDLVQEETEFVLNGLKLAAIIIFSLIALVGVLVLGWKCLGSKRIRVFFQRRESLGLTIHPPFHSTHINLNISNNSSSSSSSDDTLYVTAFENETAPPNYSSVCPRRDHLYPSLPDDSAV